MPDRDALARRVAAPYIFGSRGSSERRRRAGCPLPAEWGQCAGRETRPLRGDAEKHADVILSEAKNLFEAGYNRFFGLRPQNDNGIVGATLAVARGTMCRPAQGRPRHRAATRDCAAGGRCSSPEEKALTEPTAATQRLLGGVGGRLRGQPPLAVALRPSGMTGKGGTVCEPVTNGGIRSSRPTDHRSR